MTPVGVFFTAFLPLGVNEQALCQQPHFVPFSVRRSILSGTLVSIVSARSFPRVGQRVGQADASASKKPRAGCVTAFRFAASLS